MSSRNAQLHRNCLVKFWNDLLYSETHQPCCNEKGKTAGASEPGNVSLKEKLPYDSPLLCLSVFSRHQCHIRPGTEAGAPATAEDY